VIAVEVIIYKNYKIKMSGLEDLLKAGDYAGLIEVAEAMLQSHP
jgi:hypothetical protein